MSKKIKVYLELIEIKAKIAGIMPFLLGILYSIYKFESFNYYNSGLLLIAIFIFTSIVDLVNNYADYYNAKDEKEYKLNVNIIGRENLNTKLIFYIISTGIVIFICIGLYLVSRLGIILLYIGIYCFAVGVLYSEGPYPISRTPLGEFFSGTTMGFLIILITIMANVDINILSVSEIFIFSIPTIFAISSLMLVNNLCDIEEDKKNERKTLSIIIGRRKSIYLLYIFYFISLVGVIINYILSLAPFLYLFTVLFIVFIYFNTKKIAKKPQKKYAFNYGVKNTTIILVFQVIFYAFGVVLNL